MTAPLYVWYRGAFVAIGTNAHMQEERQKRQKKQEERQEIYHSKSI